MSKMSALQKYVSQLNNRLQAALPAKHKDHPMEYKQFLQNEIQAATKKIDALKLTDNSALKGK